MQILKLFKVNWAMNKPAVLLWTSHRDNTSGDVDQSANFLEKATPTSSCLDTASNFVFPENVLPLPKAASKKFV